MHDTLSLTILQTTVSKIGRERNRKREGMKGGKMLRGRQGRVGRKMGTLMTGITGER